MPLPELVSVTLLELMAALLFIAIHAAWIGFSYYTSPTMSDFAPSFGGLLNCDLGLALLFVPHNSLWQALFSCSFERAITYHRWVANSATLMGLAHVSTFYAVWLQQSGQVWVANAIYDIQTVCGEVALSAFFLIALFSLPYVRRQLFEVFRWAHIFLVPTFVGFLLFHYGGGVFLGWAAVALVLYTGDLLYRLYSVLFSRKSRTAIVSAKKVCNDVMKLTFQVDGGFTYSAGQYIFVILPAVTSFQSHPFSISSAPDKSGQFTVHVRVEGDFTFKLLRTIEMRPETLKTARIEGPYGALSVDPYEYSQVMFIAGGIGVTPFLSIMKDMANRGQPLPQKVSLHWSVPSMSVSNAFKEDIMQIGYVFEVHVYLTRASKSDQEMGMVSSAEHYHLHSAGRPDLPRIIREEMAQHLDDANRGAILVCGPEAMRTQVIRECNNYAVIDVHAETFAL